MARYAGCHPKHVTKQQHNMPDNSCACVTVHKHMLWGVVLTQYLGGVDPRNIPGNSTGFVNESCVVKPNKMNFEWRTRDGMLVPFADGLPLVNLHVHSKDTTRFRSDRSRGLAQ